MMSVRAIHDSSTPTASVEIVIRKPLQDYDLLEVEAETPRDVDPMLASQGFKDLLDDARAILEREISGRELEIVQLTGAICRDEKVHRPGIWLVVRETDTARKEMSAEGRRNVAAAVEAVESNLGLS